jgi:serine protease Do
MFQQLAGQLRAACVQVGGGGSGVIWSSDGLIVTNAHVAREKQVEVALPDGRKLCAGLVARDARRDLAALRVSASGLPAVELGNSDRLRVGQLVMAVGNPLGIAGAVTTGIIHALGPLQVRGQDWIQGDVSLAPGNSGGMLADAEGRVIGINTMIFAGLALAVPVNAIARFLAAGQRGARAA